MLIQYWTNVSDGGTALSQHKVNPFKQPDFTCCRLYPLQAANSCSNFRLVMDEDDLKWSSNEKGIISIKTVQ